MKTAPKNMGVIILAVVALAVVVMSAGGWWSRFALDPSEALTASPRFWAAILLGLLPFLYYAYALGRDKPARAMRLPATPALLLLALHVSVQLTGGLRSPLLAGYALAVMLVTVLADKRQGLILVVLALALEGLVHWRQGGPSTAGAQRPELVEGWSGAGFSLWALGLVASWLMAIFLALKSPRASAALQDHPAAEEGSTPHLSQSEGEIFDATRYIEESVDSLLKLVHHAHPAFNSLLLWWVDGDHIRLDRGVAKQGAFMPGIKVEKGDGLTGFVQKEAKHVVAEQMTESAAAAIPYYEAGMAVKAFIGMPLFDEGRLVGVLTADKLEEGDVVAGEVEAMQGLANQVVREVQQAQFAQSTEEKGRRYSRLYSVSRELSEDLDRDLLIAKFQQLLGHLVPYDSYYLALRGGESGEGSFEIVSKRGYDDDYVENFEMDENKAAGAWVLGEGESLLYRVDEGSAVPHFLVEGQREPARSFLLVPLMIGSRVTGLLKVDRAEKVPFDTQDKSIANIFAGQAAIALENARLYSLHLKRATTDGLTGLYNHRFFQERLAEEIENSKAKGKPLALALTDIDFFKKFNDSFGHQEGDRVLKKVAALLQETVRGQDIVCRYGGEEFVVILPDCDLVEAREVMERVRRACEEKIVGGNEEEQRGVTLSIGICAYPKGATEQRRLIHLADAALYVCKEQGRNRVASYKDLPPSELENA